MSAHVKATSQANKLGNRKIKQHAHPSFFFGDTNSDPRNIVNGLLYKHAKKYLYIEGRRLLSNHPITSLVCTKVALASLIQDKIKRRDIMPLTYNLSHAKNQATVLGHLQQAEAQRKNPMLARPQEGHFHCKDHKFEPISIWIIKPSGSSGAQGMLSCQGFVFDVTMYSGISLVSTQTALHEIINKECAKRLFIAQQYISNPLLIQGRKFDLRSYVVIVEKKAYYSFGYGRLNIEPYSSSHDSLSNVFVHLCNVHVQRAHPKYNRTHDAITFQELSETLGSETLARIEARMTQNLIPVLKHCMDKIDGKGRFCILGMDYVVDSDYFPWLLELNWRPQLRRKRKKGCVRTKIDRTFLRNLYLTVCKGQPKLHRLF